MGIANDDYLRRFNLSVSCITVLWMNDASSGWGNSFRATAMDWAISSTRSEPSRNRFSSGHLSASAMSASRFRGGSVAPLSNREIVSCSTPISSANSAWVSDAFRRRAAMVFPIFCANFFSLFVMTTPICLTRMDGRLTSRYVERFYVWLCHIACGIIYRQY